MKIRKLLHPSTWGLLALVLATAGCCATDIGEPWGPTIGGSTVDVRPAGVPIVEVTYSSDDANSRWMKLRFVVDSKDGLGNPKYLYEYVVGDELGKTANSEFARFKKTLDLTVLDIHLNDRERRVEAYVVLVADGVPLPKKKLTLKGRYDSTKAAKVKSASKRGKYPNTDKYIWRLNATAFDRDFGITIRETP